MAGISIAEMRLILSETGFRDFVIPVDGIPVFEIDAPGRGKSESHIKLLDRLMNISRGGILKFNSDDKFLKSLEVSWPRLGASHYRISPGENRETIYTCLQLYDCVIYMDTGDQIPPSIPPESHHMRLAWMLCADVPVVIDTGFWSGRWSITIMPEPEVRRELLSTPVFDSIGLPELRKLIGCLSGGGFTLSENEELRLIEWLAGTFEGDVRQNIIDEVDMSTRDHLIPPDELSHLLGREFKTKHDVTELLGKIGEVLSSVTEHHDREAELLHSVKQAIHEMFNGLRKINMKARLKGVNIRSRDPYESDAIVATMFFDAGQPDDTLSQHIETIHIPLYRNGEPRKPYEIMADTRAELEISRKGGPYWRIWYTARTANPVIWWLIVPTLVAILVLLIHHASRIISLIFGH